MTGDDRRVLLVGDPSSRTVLSGARALARAGWQVHVVGGSPRGLAGWSRCVEAAHVVRTPDQDEQAFADDLARLAAELPGAVVLACGDAELLALSRARDRLGALAGVPHQEPVQALVDKSQLALAAERAGLRVPRERSDGWPAVVKAAVHHAPGRAAPRWEVQVVHDVAELAAARARAAEAGVEVVVQEHVSGRLTALGLVLDGTGRVVGRCQQVAERIYPREAGVSARAMTVAVDDDLAGRCAGLLRAVGWTGLAQLQFLAAPGSEPCLIDVNPRLYGSLRLAVAAGAPLPDLAARVLIGDDVQRAPDARAGVRYQWLLGDLRGALAERPRDLSGVARAAWGSVGAVRDRQDPLPVLVAGAALAARATRRSAVTR